MKYRLHFLTYVVIDHIILTSVFLASLKHLLRVKADEKPIIFVLYRYICLSYNFSSLGAVLAHSEIMNGAYGFSFLHEDKTSKWCLSAGHNITDSLTSASAIISYFFQHSGNTCSNVSFRREKMFCRT